LRPMSRSAVSHVDLFVGAPLVGALL
jgi:hypothetical protein